MNLNTATNRKLTVSNHDRTIFYCTCFLPTNDGVLPRTLVGFSMSWNIVRIDLEVMLYLSANATIVF